MLTLIAPAFGRESGWFLDQNAALDTATVELVPGRPGAAPASQISVMHDGGAPRLYCCHSVHTLDAADMHHALSVDIDLAAGAASECLLPRPNGSPPSRTC